MQIKFHGFYLLMIILVSKTEQEALHVLTIAMISFMLASLS